MQTLRHYATLWQKPPPGAQTGTLVSEEEARELGWFQHECYQPLACQTVREEILPSLRALGLPLPEAELETLLAS